MSLAFCNSLWSEQYVVLNTQKSIEQTKREKTKWLQQIKTKRETVELWVTAGEISWDIVRYRNHLAIDSDAESDVEWDIETDFAWFLVWFRFLDGVFDLFDALQSDVVRMQFGCSWPTSRDTLGAFIGSSCFHEGREPACHSDHQSPIGVYIHCEYVSNENVYNEWYSLNIHIHRIYHSANAPDLR